MQSIEKRRNEIWTSEGEPGESEVGSLARRTRAAWDASADLRNATSPLGEAGPGTATSSPSTGAAELAGFLPPLGKRVERLAAMGAYVRADPAAPVPGTKPTFGPGMTTLGWVVGIFLSLVMAALFLLLFSSWPA